MTKTCGNDQFGGKCGGTAGTVSGHDLEEEESPRLELPRTILFLTYSIIKAIIHLLTVDDNNFAIHEKKVKDTGWRWQDHKCNSTII